MNSRQLSRRGFLRHAGGVGLPAAAFPAIVPRSVLGGPAAPGNRVGVGVIGVGGRGHGAIVAGLKRLKDVEIRAVCDVNRQYVERALATAGLGGAVR